MRLKVDGLVANSTLQKMDHDVSAAKLHVENANRNVWLLKVCTDDPVAVSIASIACVLVLMSKQT